MLNIKKLGTPMNLTEINPKATPNRLNKFYESRFGFTIDFDNLTWPKANKIYRTLDENLNKIKSYYGIHFSETNPKYTELLSVKEGLALWMQQNRILLEGEVSEAEVKVAARKMVDEIQAMAEKIGKMQNEELIAIIQKARDEIGIEQADAFKATASSALSVLLTTMQAQHDALDMAVRALAGEEGVGMAMPEAPMSDLDQQMEPEPTFQTTPGAAGGTEPLGRERR